jgi:hypothetical protein
VGVGTVQRVSRELELNQLGMRHARAVGRTRGETPHVHGVILIDYLCHAGQKQLVDVDIA